LAIASYLILAFFGNFATHPSEHLKNESSSPAGPEAVRDWPLGLGFYLWTAARRLCSYFGNGRLSAVLRLGTFRLVVRALASSGPATVRGSVLFLN